MFGMVAVLHCSFYVRKITTILRWHFTETNVGESNHKNNNLKPINEMNPTTPWPFIPFNVFYLQKL